MINRFFLFFLQYLVKKTLSFENEAIYLGLFEDSVLNNSKKRKTVTLSAITKQWKSQTFV